MPRTSAQKVKRPISDPQSSKRVAAPPYTRIGFLVHDVSRMRRTLFDQEVRPLGITRAQWWALANLSRHEPEGMIQSELARLLDVGKVTIGGLIDRLEASGHVERRPDEHDRRLKRIFITDLGYALIEAMAETGRRVNSRIMQDISANKIRIAEEVMHQMKNNLRAILKNYSAAESELDSD